ncbi:S8 family serine peptidase [Streptomyces sp. NBC_00237]|uniref:S8 family serine peptidase n=1 Tax=Streptomyces sp. NBC_00237 TaxID=2975687 RepID=UPI002252D49B|nr:S8 family serine peptidase [Streptomyces sp. NBC_00237]MCX5203620.1 S8 family serine peptidase [Streptomyces sp. NBC_00237]
MHRRLRPAAALAAGVLIATMAPTSFAASAAPAPAAPDVNPTGRPQVTSVTLVTGDRVRLETFPGGRKAVSVEPAPGATEADFTQLEIDKQLYVLPRAALPYLSSGKLDRQLFNITSLVKQGYDDAHTSAIPLIARYTGGTDPTSKGAPAGSRKGLVIKSLRASALKADKKQAGRFWKAIDDDALAKSGTEGGAKPPPSSKKAAFEGGVEKLWLDAKVYASLDRSTAQIGAPEAWKAGYEGQGATVAVLDTGIDATHPDLAGKLGEVRNFTSDPTAKDGHGHGTHVASTIAGSGAASGGSRKGVAPGAKLLIGKVLDDKGSGPTSAIIGGMDWAARSGADIVSMSLGGSPTDGTDVLSLTLDELSAETGTLFVVAAGNTGSDYSVGTPGTAERALTVGAVDRDDKLAPFSSRGPRVGDNGAKPDLTAPGVDIAAARAAGTSMGRPVDAAYTAASGTSMATPHVAGAAAILAGRHPDWSAQQLKDALMSTTRTAPDQTAYEQGAGRVDVARSVRQQVRATGTTTFGTLASDTGARQVKVTYTNDGDAPASLTLNTTFDKLYGSPAPAGAVGVPQQVTVPAHGTADVAVTLDTPALPEGVYGGRLTATSADGQAVAHTVLAATKDPVKHKVTVRGVDRAGKPGEISPLILLGPTGRFDVFQEVPAGQSVTVDLPQGSYYLHGVITQHSEDNVINSLVVDPQLRVSGATDLVLDARKAVPVEIRTPQRAEQRGPLVFSTRWKRKDREFVSYFTSSHSGGQLLYVTPTKEFTEGTFEFSSRWQLAAPMLGARAVSATAAAGVPVRLLHNSPAVEGVRRLRVVDAGRGRTEDYDALRARGVDVRGAAVLVELEGSEYDEAVTSAARAGAAAAVTTAGGNRYAATPWQPVSQRLPAIGLYASHATAQRLRVPGTGLELKGTPESPYLYDVVQLSEQRVPERVVHQVGPRNTATVTSRYPATSGARYVAENLESWRPWEETALALRSRYVRTGQARTEYLSGPADTRWLHWVNPRNTWAFQALGTGMLGPLRTYRPGEHVTESWYAPVVRPAIPRGVEGLALRKGGQLTIGIPEFADTASGHYGYALPRKDAGTPYPDETRAVLRHDGKVLAEGPRAWGVFPAGGDDGRYQLDLDVQRTSPEGTLSRATSTRWSFTGPRPAEGKQSLLPLLQLDYDVATDLRGSAPGSGSFVFGVSARHQDGLTGRSVKGMEVSVSYDDGGHWQAAKTSGRGDGAYRVRVTHPSTARTSGYVTLRVRAWDDAGNEVRQEIERAYALR